MAVLATNVFPLNGQIAINNLVVFGRPFGATITAIKASPVGPCTTANPCTGFSAGAGIQNKGQGGHLIVVTLPGALGNVSSLQVRLEASYTCPDPPVCASGQWFPISPDITTAAFFAGVGAINVTKSNGSFPYIRVNSLTATPGTEPMEVRYSGYPFPVGSAEVDSTGTVNITFIGPTTGPISTAGATNKYLLIEGAVTVGDCVVIAADGNGSTTACAGSVLSGVTPRMTFWDSSSSISYTPGINWEGSATATLLNVSVGSAQATPSFLQTWTGADRSTLLAGVTRDGTFESDGVLAAPNFNGIAFQWPMVTVSGSHTVYSKLVSDGTLHFKLTTTNGPGDILDWTINGAVGNGTVDTITMGDTATTALSLDGFGTAKAGGSLLLTVHGANNSTPAGAAFNPVWQVSSLNPAGPGIANNYQYYVNQYGMARVAGATLALITNADVLTPDVPGTITYCSDCAEGSDPCTGTSTGTFAYRINGRWKCQ